LSILRTGNVERHGQQVVMVANRCRDLLGIAAGRNDCVASGEGRLRDIDTPCLGLRR
jgi:hypothetical protein